MRFSIITCTYNSEQFILKNIQSVIAQTYNNFEHIFIDAFSTDATVSIINKYQKEFPHRVKFFQQIPRGISAAMNEGIKKASGEYIIHLHSDDYFYDNSVLFDVNIFLSQHKLDWIYGKIKIVEENREYVGLWPNKKIFHQTSRNSIGKYILKFFNFIPHQSVFIKKKCFQKFGYFDESISSAMDQDMWLKIRKKTEWTFFDRVIANYMVRSNSQSSSKNRKLENNKNYQIVQRRYLNFFEKTVAVIINYIIEKNNKNYR